MKRRTIEQWTLFYPEKQVTEPVICNMGRRFDIAINIFNFNVIPSTRAQDSPMLFTAIAVIEVRGETAQMIKAKEFLTSVGIKYEAHKI